MAPKTIVCGVTGSLHSLNAALEAARLAKEHQAKLVYVYAVDTDFLQGGIAVEVSREHVEDSLERLGANILEHAERVAKTQGVTPLKIVRKGSALEVVKAIVTELKADLLILGHEKKGFLERALLKGDVESHVAELKQQTGVDVAVIQCGKECEQEIG